MWTDWSFPRWNQVFLKVHVQKTNQTEICADVGGKEETEKVFESKFWLGYFDFPLSDNTYLSNKERYTFVLDSIDYEKKFANISVIYFPASMAGMKEKSFYHQKMMDLLLKEKKVLGMEQR